MCGLAWRWRIRRSVKNACKVVARAVMRHLRGDAPAVHRPVAATPEQLRDTSRFGRDDMAEIGRQQREPGAWVAAIAIAVKDGADGEGVANIV